ncbi:MAG TPA: D-aminoacyl-tRNA deacylase [Paludibacteraceae bacterium]|nr:D-aminoacyl-tRNA deacylase [Paludibacteraceae bacterium]HPT42208.1 D-aminoacyl-tRNA deacylase [Paludibacteraceae bacterium]
MRILIQRVKRASVTIENHLKSEIKTGLLVFVGIEDADDEKDSSWLASKLVKMRIFNDEKGVMNLPVTEVDGEIMIISQFTLHAQTQKGNRPSYIKAARPEKAIPLYEHFCNEVEQLLKKPVKTGEFGADMQVELINDGPVTIWMDSKLSD